VGAAQSEFWLQPHAEADAVHVPFWHTSGPVQLRPSSQDVPVNGVCTQEPLLMSQLGAWHASDAAQVTGLAPTQLPAWHASVWVQALASLQLTPSALDGLVHTPVPALHVPAVWHWSSGAHTTALAPVHEPAWQVSVCVHRSPSEQVEPLGLAGLVHAPELGSQVPAT
jgi:hypothetical protein